MSAIWTVVLFILIRFALLSIYGKEAMSRAAFFAPLVCAEKTAYVFYQLSNAMIIVYLCFLKIDTAMPWFWIGAVILALGTIITYLSVFNFAKPEQNGFNRKGLYRISRNPMYVGYFIYFLGCVLLTRSLILMVILAVFQISAHWIILSEERWCINKFGEEYILYMQKVRRYI